MPDAKEGLTIRARTPNRDYRVDTPGAGVPSQPLRVSNSHWWHLQTCLGTEPVIITFPDHNKSLLRALGQSGDVTEGFTVLQLTTQTAQTIVLTCGDDRELDPRSLATNSSAPVPVTEGGVQANNKDGVASVAALSQVVVNTGSAGAFLRLYVSNDAASPGPIFVQDSLTGPTPKGIQVMPGQTVELKTSRGFAAGFYTVTLYNPQPSGAVAYWSYEGR